MAYPDFSKDFHIACDASNTGLGEILFQKAKIRMQAILSKAERNCSTRERENV